MNEKTEGIILKELDYKENSIILTVLTEAYGKISLIARGTRKMTSKNRAGTLPYTFGEYHFDFREGRTMFQLKTAVCLDLFRFLHEDLNAGAAAAVIAELADGFTMEGEDLSFSREALGLVRESFALLCKGHPADLVLAVTAACLMKHQGIAPHVESCVLCGDTRVTSISPKEGGFLCASCAERNSSPAFPRDALQRFRLLNRAELSHMEILEKHMDSAVGELSILISLIRMHTGLPIRSYALFERLYARGTN